MTPAERIWTAAKAAAYALGSVRDTLLIRPSIALGPGISEELAKELEQVSGGTFELYRAADEESSLIKVYWSMSAYVGGVYVYALNSRPATSADESIPLRGGRA
jgi:hypothetical protein